MILGDLDIWEQAFKEMDLSENVQFVSRGRLITEASQVEMFNKIQALLNSDGMESSHKWLYSLDPSELSESECSKVNNLWNLGIERGFIEDPDAEDSDAEEPVVEEPVAPTPAPVTPAPASTSAFTVLYSAMRGGEIKSGESYSNAVSPRAAKADIISQLERAGYSNIKILAIECGDPDDCGKDNCSNTYCAQANNQPIVVPDEQIPDYSEDAIPFESDKDDAVEEADDKETDAEKTDDKEADNKEADEKADSEKSDDKDSDKDSDSDSEADKKKEDAKEPDEKLKDDADDKAEKASDKEKEDKELDASEKTALKDSYKKAFKAAMQKCKFFDRAFDDLTLEEKVAFFTELSKAWGSKADPSKFMSDKEIQQLQTIVVKK